MISLTKFLLFGTLTIKEAKNGKLKFYYIVGNFCVLPISVTRMTRLRITKIIFNKKYEYVIRLTGLVTGCYCSTGDHISTRVKN